MQSCSHMYTNNIPPPPPSPHTHTHTHSLVQVVVLVHTVEWCYCSWYTSRMTSSNMRRHLCRRLKYGVLVDIFSQHHQILYLHDMAQSCVPSCVCTRDVVRSSLQPTHSSVCMQEVHFPHKAIFMRKSPFTPGL